MAEFFEGDILTNGLKIHYYRSGGGKPPIVLCHGVTDNGLCWTPVARALKENYDMIMPDSRWHGLSEGPADGNQPNIQVEDLFKFVQALDLKKPVLMGHSMGANTVFQVGIRYPELARAIILEDPPYYDPANKESIIHNQAFIEWLSHSLVEYKTMSREALIEMIHKESPTWPEDELGPWADSKLQVSLNLAKMMEKSPMPADPWEDMAKIICPVMLISADPEKGAIITPEVARKAVQALPSLRVVRISGAGHNIHREAFGLYMAAINDFLAGV